MHWPDSGVCEDGQPVSMHAHVDMVVCVCVRAYAKAGWTKGPGDGQWGWAVPDGAIGGMVGEAVRDRKGCEGR